MSRRGTALTGMKGCLQDSNQLHHLVSLYILMRRCQTEFLKSALHAICISCSELPKSVKVGDVDNMRYACLDE